MKIVHHSNYVKWMEEARNHYFMERGFDWGHMESTTGIMIPVLFQSVEYKHMLRFGDEVEICCRCDKFNGVKMDFSYVFTNSDSEMICAIGMTKHGFIDKNYNPVSLRDGYPSGYETLNSAVNISP